MNNRISRYFVYAIGEIILVVIGILIAIQLDAWRTERKNRVAERTYLESLLVELKVDSLSHIGGWTRRYGPKKEGLQLAKDFYYGDYKVTDTIEFLNKIGMGGIGSVGGSRLNNKTFQDLINTGNFSLINNKDLRNQISYYYSYMDFTIAYLNNLRSNYAARLNSLRPYDPNNPKYVDKRDIKFQFGTLTKPDMIELINQEITFGYSADNRYNDIHKMGLALSDSIKSYLNNPRN